MENQNQEFNLDAPAVNNYLNILLRYIKFYQDCTIDRSFSAAVNVLRSLILTLPPKGQEALKDEIELFRKYDSNTSIIRDFGQLDKIFQKTMIWLYPNLLELHFNNAQPRSKETARIGVQS
jgi:hypothetical protein